MVELPFGFVSSENTGGAGGTCVIRGCVPKKLLVYASEFSDCYKDAGGFGWGTVKPSVNLHHFIQKKAKEIERLNSVYKDIIKASGADYIEGRGFVIDPHTIEVRRSDGSVQTVTAKNILVATGSHAVKIPIPGAEYAITSDEALVIEELPGTCIVIIGGGYIAVEFAGIFAGLGAKVHLMYRAAFPLRGFDDECRAVVSDNLQKRGVVIHCECSPQGIEKNSDGTYTLHYRDSMNATHAITCGEVMMATGRKPSTKGIGLENAGVELDSRSGAVVVNEYSRTSTPNIWAIGDATDRMNLTPVALMEGKAVAQSIFGGKPKVPDYENIPTAVFCQPPMGTVGLTEEQAIEQLDGELAIYISKFRPMKNTLSGRDEKTFMKMIVHIPTDRVVGCHMVGPDAAEIMQGLGVALKCGATKAQFDSCVGIHPSAAEEWVTMSAPARKVKCKGAHMATIGAQGYKV